MEALNAKEFLEKLKTNTLKAGLKLVGIVKKSDKDGEVMFASKLNPTHWVAIPASMIESVVVLKELHWGDASYTLVKLHLQTPTNAETKTLYDLLAATAAEGHHHEAFAGIGSLIHKFWHGHAEGHCHSHCRCNGHCNCPDCKCNKDNK